MELKAAAAQVNTTVNDMDWKWIAEHASRKL